MATRHEIQVGEACEQAVFIHPNAMFQDFECALLANYRIA